MLPIILRGIYSRLINGLLNIFTTKSAQEFERFTTASLPGVSTAEQASAIVKVEPLYQTAELANPAACEEMFTRALKSGSYDQAWDLLTPDSQESWERPEVFKREMANRGPGKELVESRVRQVRFLSSWTDNMTRRTHRQVAELIVDYRIRHQAKELVVTRDVHLVNVSGGWKSLCYRT